MRGYTQKGLETIRKLALVAINPTWSVNKGKR